MSTICARCIKERWLANYVTANATEDECDFCGRKSKRPIATELGDIMPHIRERIECLYEDPANSVGYDSAEGGYQLPTMDTFEVLDNVGLGVDDDDLRQELAEGVGLTEWVERNPYSLSREDALQYSWEEFADVVKHKVRYLLSPPKVESGSYSETLEPAEVLDELGDTFMRHDLVSTLKAGTRLYRVRLHTPGKPPGNNISELGPPPIDCAKFASRMSPAGISMFYGALDEATALAETYVRLDGRPAEATIAVFETVEALTVLGLTKLPEYPSVFASDEANLERPSVHFLHTLARDFTRPVEKDGREHVDYVPSQVVTEYIRYRLGEKLEKPVRGVLYSSARKEGGVGCVLFVSHEDIERQFRPDKTPFKLLPKLTRTIAVDTRPR